MARYNAKFSNESFRTSDTDTIVVYGLYGQTLQDDSTALKPSVIYDSHQGLNIRLRRSPCEMEFVQHSGNDTEHAGTDPGLII